MYRVCWRNDIDVVLQLARDELGHLERDAKHDQGSQVDYRDSKAALDRVEAALSSATQGEVCPVRGHRCRKGN